MSQHLTPFAHPGPHLFLFPHWMSTIRLPVQLLLQSLKCAEWILCNIHLKLDASANIPGRKRILNSRIIMEIKHKRVVAIHEFIKTIPMQVKESSALLSCWGINAAGCWLLQQKSKGVERDCKASLWAGCSLNWGPKPRENKGPESGSLEGKVNNKGAKGHQWGV